MDWFIHQLVCFIFCTCLRFLIALIIFIKKVFSMRSEEKPGVVASTYNPAILEAEFQNGMGVIPIGANSPSIGG